MDFIERIFGISPDGGDGSTERLWFAAAAAILLAIMAARFFSKRASR